MNSLLDALTTQTERSASDRIQQLEFSLCYTLRRHSPAFATGWGWSLPSVHTKKLLDQHYGADPA